jgi:hypothetical protein
MVAAWIQKAIRIESHHERPCRRTVAVQEIARKSRKMKAQGFRRWEMHQKLPNKATGFFCLDGAAFASVEGSIH